jgi:osmoprotectant transport system permease protein
VSIPSQIWHFLGSGSSWTGQYGVPARLGQHAAICAVTLALAAVVALPLGVGLARLRRGGWIASSLANAGRSVPVLGVLILFAVGPLGVGTSAAVAALVIFALPPLVTNAYTGIREVDADVRLSAVAMGMTSWQVLWRVELPLALPLIAAGVRIAAVQVWATATLAAIVGSGGLGRFIVDGYAIQDYGQVYGGAIVVAITAILLEGLLAWAQRRLHASFGGAVAPAAEAPVARSGTAVA